MDCSGINCNVATVDRAPKSKRANPPANIDPQKIEELIKAEKYGEAILLLGSFLSKHPKHPNVTNLRKILASAYEKNRQFDLAIQQMEKVIAQEPNNADNYAILGFIYRRANKIAQAIKSYRRALELDPKPEYLSEIHFCKAYEKYFLKFALSQKAWDEVCGYLNEAIKVNPNNSEAYELLGYIYEDKGDLSRGDGKKELARKYYINARNEYLKALQYDPANTRILFYLGRVHFFLEEYNSAYQYLESFLKEEPQDQQAQDLMKQIKEIILHKDK